jgi:VanZ family protein
MNKKIFFSPLIPPIFLMGLIFISSSIPMQKDTGHLKFLTDLDPTLQNFLHIPLFCLLSYLWLRTLKRIKLNTQPAVVFTLLITVLFGCLDEFHQTFVSGRYGSLMDICLNIIGIISGILFFFVVSKQRRTIINF